MQVKEVKYDVGPYTIAGKLWGEGGGTPIIALHGWLDNAATYDTLAPLLPKTQLLAIDLLGHGLSSHRSSDASYYFWEYANDILRLIDVLKWDKFTLIGHSLGAGIASLLTGTIPEKVNKLILLDGLGPLTDKPEDCPKNLLAAYLQKQQLESKALPIYKSVDDAVQMRMKGITGDISEQAARCLVNRCLKKVEKGYTWTNDIRLKLRSPLRLSEEQAAAFLKNVVAPTYLILAEQGMFMEQEITAKYVKRLDYFSNLQMAKISGGHHFHLEDSANQIAAIINQFLFG